MLIKSKSFDNHLVNLKENFLVMKHNKVRINLIKCAFEEVAESFLGFMLIERGIEVNLAKCKAILEI